jgi:8-amino-7-oxononanoate synthase
LGNDFLLKRLKERREQNALRTLRLPEGTTDFCSNDYLGIVKNNLLQPGNDNLYKHGSTGSRLLSGNYQLIEETEKEIAAFHEAEAGLIFNSGYDGNLGLLSSVPQRTDTILYDYLSHASLRDGIRLSFARSFSFLHNDLADLEKKLKEATGNIFIITESVFSMDGDIAPLTEMVSLCERFKAHLIVDEAHATGVVGNKGEGMVQMLKLQKKCFARIHTFGKACGAHGAIILGSNDLKDYLINFSRPFIYTTSLPETSITAIKNAYSIFPGLVEERKNLEQLIWQFQETGVRFKKLKSNTPIQGVVIPGNEEVKQVAALLHSNRLDVRPILYPTIPKGEERLRIVLHSYNTSNEVHHLLKLLN